MILFFCGCLAGKGAATFCFPSFRRGKEGKWKLISVNRLFQIDLEIILRFYVKRNRVLRLLPNC